METIDFDDSEQVNIVDANGMLTCAVTVYPILQSTKERVILSEMKVAIPLLRKEKPISLNNKMLGKWLL